ncbi:porin family protein [Winogradskyella sp. PE311]|uniref:porin family protein n=1 Tax=Winogradskyella sp. PE311 TaxID=3366943 RepID=UPI00397EDFF5
MRSIIILFFLLSISLYAQRNPVGIKVGSNLSKLVGNNTDNLTFSVRPQFGLFMQIPIDDFGAFQPELLYTGHGYKQEDFGGEPNVGLNYLALAVLTKILIIKKFSLDVGPQFGLLLSANDKEDILPNIKSDFYNRDFGVNLGFSYDLLKKITASFRYYIGLTDITRLNSKNFNRSFQIAFQYKIN